MRSPLSSASSDRGQHLARRAVARIPRTVGGRKKIRRGRLARKEQPVIDGRCKDRAVTGVAGQGVRVGATREGIEGPARFRQRRQPAPKIVAEKGNDFV